jgi:hypothetical protein
VARLTFHGVIALVSTRRRVAAAALALGAASGVGSCTLGDAPPNCVPGHSDECVGANACKGHQVCRDDGYRYGECVCDPPKGLPPIIIEAGADGRLPNLLGAPCQTDAECGPLLFCLTSKSQTIFGGGPSNGLCVADCAKDGTKCAGLDPTSICRTFDDKGTTNSTSDDIAYCTRGCVAGSPGGMEKCFDRPDVACLALGTGTTKGTCIPACRNDADCSPRFCNLASGLCTDGPKTGLPIGSTCSATNRDECAGFCRATGTFMECSGYCSNGRVGCGESVGPPFNHLCLAPLTTGQWAEGDFGYCRKLCDCDDDCGRADAVCSPLPAAQANAAGRKGECRASTTSAGDPRTGIACP